jgi:predicted amidohydrolase
MFETSAVVDKSNYIHSCVQIIHTIFILTTHQCYDVRFPELSLTLAQMGADILTFPSAFTYVTGSAHWETILRARAIESQCYVIAAAQTGVHNSKRSSWGHAIVCILCV